MQRHKVNNVLMSSVFRQKIMQVDCYPIPVCNLDDLILNKMAFNIKTAELFSGNIRLDRSTDAILRVGAFKTAQAAQLTLSPLTRSGIGSIPNYEIVLKRPYISDSSFPDEPAGPPFTRFALKDESNILYREANVLYWAKALLKMTYEFIDHAIDAAKEPPPFDVPRLRFVDAGLLLAYSNAPAEECTLPSVNTAAAVSMMFLGEELIPTPSNGDDFVKYIHNGDAAPCVFLDPETENIADFLAFTQHIQYVKTGGQVYISDYQGIFVSNLEPLY